MARFPVNSAVLHPAKEKRTATNEPRSKETHPMLRSSLEQMASKTDS
jgi:hypothetical protein